MTAREQTGDSEFYRLVLSYNNLANLLGESVNVLAHPEIICGNDALRKQDLRGVDLSVFLFLLLLLLLLLQCWLWRCYLLRSPGFSNTFSWRRAQLARRSLGGDGRTRPTKIRMGWSRGGMGVAITLCDETKYECRKDKHDNSL